MTKENLLRDLLNDEQLKTKYGLTETMIKNARLTAPFEHEIIEYLATIIVAHMDQHLGQTSVYNKIKNVIKIA